MILNPLKSKEDNNIFREINNYLDKNEKEIKNRSTKNFIENTNFSSKNLIRSKYIQNDLEFKNLQIPNNIESQKLNIFIKKSDIILNNTNIIDSTNQKIPAYFNNNNNDLNTKNKDQENQSYFKNEYLGCVNNYHEINKNNMVENKIYKSNKNNHSCADIDNYSNNNLNNSKNPVLNYNASNIEKTIDTKEDRLIFNNKLENNLINSVNNKLNNLLKNENPIFIDNLVLNNNTLKNLNYQSVGDKKENFLNKEKLVLEKIKLDLQKYVFQFEIAKGNLNSSNLNKDEENKLKLEIKTLEKNIDILMKERDKQETKVKEAEINLSLKEFNLAEKFYTGEISDFHSLNNIKPSHQNLNNSNLISNCSMINTKEINDINTNLNLIQNKIEKYNNIEDQVNEKNIIPHLNDSNKFYNNFNLAYNKENISMITTERLFNKNTDSIQMSQEIKEEKIYNENFEKNIIREKIIKQEKEKMEKSKLMELENERFERFRLESENIDYNKLETDKLNIYNDTLKMEINEKENIEKAFRDKLENDKIAELMKKLEEEKQQRIIFEEKIKKLEAEKKEREEKPIKNKLNFNFGEKEEIQKNSLKNSENNIHENNKNNNFLNSNNFIGKNNNNFKFDISENMNIINRNTQKYGEIKFNLSNNHNFNNSKNNSFVNEIKDQIKSSNFDLERRYNNHNIQLTPVNDNSDKLNNPFAKINPPDATEKNGNKFFNNKLILNDKNNFSKNNLDETRTSFDNIKGIFNKPNDVYNNLNFDEGKEPPVHRISEPLIAYNKFTNNFINVNPVLTREDNNNRGKDFSKNNSLINSHLNDSLADENYNNIKLNINLSKINKLENLENKKINSLNSSILSDKDNNFKEKYNFKSFIFANKSADTVNNLNFISKNVISFDSKIKYDINAKVNYNDTKSLLNEPVVEKSKKIGKLI